MHRLSERLTIIAASGVFAVAMTLGGVGAVVALAPQGVPQSAGDQIATRSGTSAVPGSAPGGEASAPGTPGPTASGGADASASASPTTPGSPATGSPSPAVGTQLPHGSGAPAGPSTTGVPVGTSLTVHQGDLTITTAGTVVNALDIHGLVIVKASNVTIKNSIVRGRAVTVDSALVSNTNPGLVIQDSELYDAFPSYHIKGVVASNVTLLRDNIHDVTDNVHIIGDNVRVESSWLHGNLHYGVDPDQGNTPTHDDNIQIQNGSNLTFVNNRMEGGHNSAIQITQDRGPVSNVTVSSNWMNNGNCTVNIIDKTYGPVANVVITGNTFGRDTTYHNCGIISTGTTTPSLIDNHYVDGAPVGLNRF